MPGTLKDAHQRQKGPATPYKPAGIETGAPISAAERAATSRVLNNPALKHKPPPPPRRCGAAGSGSSDTGLTPSGPPQPPARAAAPRPPPRTNSIESIGSSTYANPPSLPSRGSPTPSYEHAVAHDLPKPAPPPRSGPPQPWASTAYNGGRDRSASTVSAVPGHKPFSQYGHKEKEELFGMLDEFFASRLKPSTVPTSLNSSATSPPPPSVSLAARPHPSLSPTTQGPSYPPPQSHSSSALSLLHYVLYAPYESSWFLSPSPTPDPLRSRNDTRWTGSWSQRGDQKCLTSFCLFGDCSVAWWKLSWSARDEERGFFQGSEGSNRVKKEGSYRPIPQPWDGEKLYEASETYGPLIVDFAGKAVESRRPVARGECWDLASEALSVGVERTRPDLQKPFPSIGRTHGHLMFYGKAGQGDGTGVWRGGDAYVRPGDIVEWRTVTIREVGMAPGAYSTLGAPDHTAIIISAGTPTASPTDGQPYPISSLVSLTVVEQSLGSLPAEKTYDMRTMTKGEVWIYRPVGLKEYVGCEVEAEWPPKCQAWRVGELE